jgi:glutaredoxin
MKKVYTIIIAFFAVSLIVIGILTGLVIQKEKNKPLPIPQENASVSSMILYYGSTCPHCKIVEQFIEDNNVTQKISIARKEVYEDKANADELRAVAEKCGLATDSIGVPFVAFNGKCYVGQDEVTSLIKKEAGIA